MASAKRYLTDLVSTWFDLSSLFFACPRPWPLRETFARLETIEHRERKCLISLLHCLANRAIRAVFRSYTRCVEKCTCASYLFMCELSMKSLVGNRSPISAHRSVQRVLILRSFYSPSHCGSRPGDDNAGLLSSAVPLK